MILLGKIIYYNITLQKFRIYNCKRIFLSQTINKYWKKLVRYKIDLIIFYKKTIVMLIITQPIKYILCKKIFKSSINY